MGVASRLGAELRQLDREGLKQLIPGFTTIKKELLAVYRSANADLEEIRKVFRAHGIISKSKQLLILSHVTRGKMNFYCRNLGLPCEEPVVQKNDEVKLQAVKDRLEKRQAAARVIPSIRRASESRKSSGLDRRNSGRRKKQWDISDEGLTEAIKEQVLAIARLAELLGVPVYAINNAIYTKKIPVPHKKYPKGGRRVHYVWTPDILKQLVEYLRS